MPKEGNNPRPLRHSELFGLNEHEHLYEVVSDKRFLQLLQDEQTQVHSTKMSGNMYGEFLFVTMSRPGENARVYITFWSLGFHEQREQWINGNWRWYEVYGMRPDEANIIIPKAEVETQLNNRRSEIADEVDDTKPSQRALLFGILADLTDEDGAYTELEDLDNLGMMSGLFDDDNK